MDDSAGQGLGWWQRLIVSAGDDTIVRSHPVELRERSLAFDVQEPAAFVLAGGRGLGYGAFPLDAHSRVWLLQHVERVPEPLTRAVAWVALWDALLDGTVGAEAFIDGVIRALALEREESLIERLVAMLSKAFWLFLTAPMREAAAVRIETVLSQRLASSNSPASAAMWFSAYRHLVLSAEGCRWLADVWSHEAQVPGLRLSDVDRVGTICELAVREHAGWQSMLDAQLGRTVDPDLRGRLAFLAPALSDDPGTRETAWAELADVAHRRREPWVLARVQWLNHPLRQVFARRFIVPGLDLLPELARTGDIFFPSRWASALLGGHGSAAAVALVDAWLRQRQDVDEPLRRNVLVAADVLFAAARPR